MGAHTRISVLVVCVAVTLSLAASAAATPATFTWAGVDAHTLWSEGVAWEGAMAPTAADGPIDLDFPLSACGQDMRGCPTTTDDVNGLTLGTLTLASRVIGFTPKTPFEPPPAEPAPESYTIDASGPLTLVEGIDVVNTEAGSGIGIASTGGTIIKAPIVLGADNVWSIGPAPGGGLNVWGPVSGDHRLTISLAQAQLELAESTDVGPLVITGPGNVVFGGLAGADLNGSDGEPVEVRDASLNGSGVLGELTLRDAFMRVGFAGGPGAVHVSGDAAFDHASSIYFENPSPPASRSILLVSGHLEIGSAQLVLYANCPSPGTTFTLVEAAGGVTGTFSDRAGEALANGETISPEEAGCPFTESAHPLRVEYQPDSVTVTALGKPEASPESLNSGESKTPSTGTAPSIITTTTGASSGVAAYIATARTLLARNLAVAEVMPRIPRLLRRGGTTIVVQAPQAGLLSFTITVARSGGRGSSEIVGSGSVRFTTSGQARLRLRLIRHGRLLLARARHLPVELVETFAGAGAQPLVLTAKLTLVH
jgi:hypothetical protein